MVARSRLRTSLRPIASRRPARLPCLQAADESVELDGGQQATLVRGPGGLAYQRLLVWRRTVLGSTHPLSRSVGSGDAAQVQTAAVPGGLRGGLFPGGKQRVPSRGTAPGGREPGSAPVLYAGRKALADGMTVDPAGRLPAQTPSDRATGNLDQSPSGRTTLVGNAVLAARARARPITQRLALRGGVHRPRRIGFRHGAAGRNLGGLGSPGPPGFCEGGAAVPAEVLPAVARRAAAARRFQ